ncbi:hypothetical protein G647_04930 [Cladophialophora carrionii CBS 160.54]|uniref:Uncharacterized protein n=1 Tax=Cladophialophora carrionii CBS 160.54 TaxID=1279043 RepID=V9DA06_9EURO|nr:uncharacterized protein G647_04930 [Cladophialophora carrionii CBS 160.54]ETI23133.1 hypothetical protein G647_04930 [Cladophialophora carrionii CBS 160.54]
MRTSTADGSVAPLSKADQALAVMSRTKVTASQHIMVLSLPSRKQQWPNPEESIDAARCFHLLNDRFQDRIVPYKWWGVKGPALAAYLEIDETLHHFLSSRDDFFEGERKTHLFHSAGCYMVGRKASSARPCIAIGCESKVYCQRATAALQHEQWWLNFTSKYPGFRLVEVRNAPRPRSLGNETRHLARTDTLKPLEVYTSHATSSLYGAPFYAADEEADVLTLRAVIGGVVFLGGYAYGLTVAHAVQKTVIPDDQEPDVDEEDGQTYFTFLDDDDADEEPNGADEEPDDADEEPDDAFDSDAMSMESFGSTRESIPMRSTPRLAANASRRLGYVKFESSRTADDSLDWALISLENGSTLVEQVCAPPSQEDSDRAARLVTDVRGPPWESIHAEAIRGVSGVPEEAYVSGAPEYIRLPDSKQFAKVYAVRLSSEIGE